MCVMYVIPHFSNRILDFFWELPSVKEQKIFLVFFVQRSYPALSIVRPDTQKLWAEGLSTARKIALNCPVSIFTNSDI